MPVLTRSNITGPIKTMTGVKRKFIEILDTDDDSSSDYDVATDSETEDDYKLKYDEVMLSLVREQERVQELEEELERAEKRIASLREGIREFQNTSFLEIMCFVGVIIATLATTASALYTCNTYEHALLTI